MIAFISKIKTGLKMFLCIFFAFTILCFVSEDEAINNKRFKKESSIVYTKAITAKDFPNDSSLLVYTNDSYNFSFNYPLSWEIMTPAEAIKKSQGHWNVKNVAVYLVHERDMDCNLNIQVIPFEGEEPSTSDLIMIRDYLDEQYPKEFEGYKKISSKIIKLNGTNALEFIFENKRLGLILQQKVVQFVTKRRAYIFAFTSPKQKYEKSDDDCFSVVLSTFKSSLN